MKSEIQEKTTKERAAEYYRGERISNALVFFIGMGMLIWAIVLFLIRRGMLSSGILISTIPFAVFCIITGIYRFRRSLWRFTNIKDVATGDQFLKEEEIDHLAGRTQRFRRKREVDGIGLLVGFGLLMISILFSLNHILLGTSISIIAFSSVLLVFDLFGQFRTEEFLRQLKK